MAYAPPVTFYSLHTPGRRPLERPLAVDGALRRVVEHTRLHSRRRCGAGGGGSGWGFLSPTLMGVGARRPSPCRGRWLFTAGSAQHTSVLCHRKFKISFRGRLLPLRIRYKTLCFAVTILLSRTYYRTVRPTAAHTVGAYWLHIGFTLAHVGFTLVHIGCADWLLRDCSDWCSKVCSSGSHIPRMRVSMLGDCNRSRRQSSMQSSIGSSGQFTCDEARAQSVQRVRIGCACSARKSVAQC